MQLNLSRPIIFFDLETTGTSVTSDRIVEISLIKVFPDGSTEEKSRRINPECHIPEASSAIHHITDDDVKDAPTFRQIAKSLHEMFDNCDIAGFNSNKFDVPLLIEEFGRAGLSFDVAGRNFVDVQGIFHKMEQRTLVAAYRFYCGKDLNDAHSAVADARATYEVLLSQLDRYPELKNDVKALSEFSSGGRNVDLAGRMVYDDNNEPIFNFGKNKGKKVKDVVRHEPGFIQWILQGDFPKETKDQVRRLQYEFSKR